MHIGKTWLLALKDIRDLSGAKDCTHVNSTLLKKNAFLKIYRGSPLGTIHCWSWIMQEFYKKVTKTYTYWIQCMSPWRYSGCKIKTKECVQNTAWIWFCLPNGRDFTRITWKVSLLGLLASSLGEEPKEFGIVNVALLPALLSSRIQMPFV